MSNDEKQKLFSAGLERLLKNTTKAVCKYDVIQANEKAGKWCGCLLIVDEVKEHSVLAYMKSVTTGVVFVHLNKDEFEIIGEAVFSVEK